MKTDAEILALIREELKHPAQLDAGAQSLAALVELVAEAMEST